MNWEEHYQKGDAFWDKGVPSPPMQKYLERHPVQGRAVAQGLDAIGLDIAPTAIAGARARYPELAERFVVGDLFHPPLEMRGAFEVVLEHTCLSGLTPSLRADYRRGIDLTLRPGGILIGVWYINPDLDPGQDGPPFPFSVPDLTALFAQGYAIVADYVPDVAFPNRVGRERVRVLRRKDHGG
jgi:methyl halide transferase